MFKELKTTFKIGLSLRKLKNADEIEKDKAMDFVLSTLSSEQGIFTKFSQYLGSNKLPDQANLLYSNKNLLTIEDIKKIFEDHFQISFDNVFESIDEKAHKASIGQVHKAKLKNGNIVALKIQYPNIKETVYDQLKLLNLFPLLSKTTPLKKWGIPIEDYKKLFKELIDKELNYLEEVKNIELFRKQFKDDPLIDLPFVYQEYTNPQLYIQKYIEGHTIDTAQENLSYMQLEYASRILFKNFCQQVFINGFFQSDTNHGNFIISHAPSIKVAFIDMGSFYRINNKVRLALSKLVFDIINKDYTNIMPLLGDLGFDLEKLSHIEKNIHQVINALMWPILDPSAKTLEKWNLNQELDSILGEYKWWFRSSGGNEFFTLLKAFSGIKGIFTKWNVQLNWQTILLEVLAPNLDQIKSYQAQTKYENKIIDFSAMAKEIKISVKEKNIEKVNLTLPITAFDNLGDFIETKTKEKLLKRGINFNQILEMAKSEGLQKQTLFKLEEGTKIFHVYLN